LRIRLRFASAVLGRAGNKCEACGAPGPLDPHHITDRNEIVDGGYVPENGIALCPACHRFAEYHHTGEPVPPGYTPDELYARIGSSRARAEAAAAKQAGKSQKG